MPSPTHSLQFVYSGGALNEDPIDSLGGAASQAAGRIPISQGFDTPPITGLGITYAARNPIGEGDIEYDPAVDKVFWTPLGGDRVGVDSRYTGIKSVGKLPGGFIQVSLNESLLPASYAIEPISIEEVLETLFGEHPPTAPTLGILEYRCLYLHNPSSVSLSSVSLSISSDGAFSTLSLGSPLLPHSNLTFNPASVADFRHTNPFMNVPALLYDREVSSDREGLALSNPDGTPHYHAFVPYAATYSDGATTNLPVTIADRYDSGGELAGIAWRTNLVWSAVPAGAYLWFWIKKDTLPYGAVGGTESVHLDVLATQ